MRISDWSSDGCSSDLKAMAISKYQSFIESSSINGANAPYVEAYYEQFLDDPESIDPSWRAYFRLIQDQNAPREVPHSSSEERRVGKECVSRCRSRGSQ